MAQWLNRWDYSADIPGSILSQRELIRVAEDLNKGAKPVSSTSSRVTAADFGQPCIITLVQLTKTYEFAI